jgi:hypothetical protein
MRMGHRLIICERKRSLADIQKFFNDNDLSLPARRAIADSNQETLGIKNPLD